MGVFVFLLLAMMLSVVNAVVRGTGGFFALLGNLVEDARFGFFFGGVVGHGDEGLWKALNFQLWEMENGCAD